MQLLVDLPTQLPLFVESPLLNSRGRKPAVARELEGTALREQPRTSVRGYEGLERTFDELEPERWDGLS